MSPSPAVAPPRLDQASAYTTPRPDIAALVPPTSRRVLDVGCSNGELGLSLKHQLPGCTVHGLELNEAHARMAATRLDKVQCVDLDHFDWQQALAGERFDCIIFADVLEHLADPLRHLTAARAALAPQGRIVVSLPNVRHLSALVAIYVQGRFPRRDRGIFDRTHRHWFTLADGEALLREAGLEPIAQGLSLRFGDRGGGCLNRLLNRLPAPVQRWSPVREFLTYQVCFLAAAAPA